MQKKKKKAWEAHFCFLLFLFYPRRAHDKSLGRSHRNRGHGRKKKEIRVLILFIYLPLWIIVSVNQRQLDKGFHAAENSYTATLEGDRQRRLYLSPALISAAPGVNWFIPNTHTHPQSLVCEKCKRVWKGGSALPGDTSGFWHVQVQNAQLGKKE